jgi:hypothetical protein
LLEQVQVQATEHAAKRQLAVLSEARYFDSLTQHADVYILTYNSQSHVFGVTTIIVEQSNVGSFHVDVTVSAVNAAWPATTRARILAFALPLGAVLLACVSCLLTIEAMLWAAASRWMVLTTCPSYH